MYKVLASCGAGIGSSLIIKKKIQSVADKLGIEVDITHLSIGSAKSQANNFDVIFTLAGLKDNFDNVENQNKVIGLKNILSDAEIEEGLKTALNL
ncbi:MULTISPECIES: PTS sugar transporter subunit IIB [Aerococcus]|uniref:PTS sugar transporter subunit IIB n=1 Tax=Aerococcus TaxID=1375 RepID=UPI000DCB6E2D|nr:MULTISPECIES: PTS sugar transporter subunit IIB [Aerococcus]KAA9295729.1 PTS sugar transporter subunit IIB [Aerococcus tenax]MDK6688153.1 PTS sugar transporter subunit IIB [Aerococcus urinae]MDK8132727.1 PTS sugar transporter subunit IIB [Aerococcus urinae]MDK8484353.1 PTS sugar transporter subunit IIB [Aerococcus urinae]MDL5179365.1 PTS sugar transporter subunit IIB [Aerococcus tenax]